MSLLSHPAAGNTNWFTSVDTNWSTIEAALGPASGRIPFSDGTTMISNASLYWDNSNSRMGLGTSTPRQRLDVLDSTNPQLRLTQTDGSIYTDLQSNSSGQLDVIATGGRIRLTHPSAAQTVDLMFYDGSFTTLRGELVYAGSNSAGNRYFGLINRGGDNLRFFSDQHQFSSISGSVGGGTFLVVSPTASSSGTPIILNVAGPASSGIANAESVDVLFALNRTVTFTGGGGAIPTQRAVEVLAPTYAASAAQTITSAATLYVDKAPLAGTNVTLSESYSLWSGSGMIGVFNYAAGSESVAVALYPYNSGNVGGLAAYGIGMGPTATEGYVSYRSGTSSTSSFGHKWFVNNVELMRLRGDGQLYVNSGASPTVSQIRVQANALSAWTVLDYAADNVQMGFDVEYNAGWIARNAAVAWIAKASPSSFNLLAVYGSTGNSVGNTAAQTFLAGWALGSGNFGLNTANPRRRADFLDTLNPQLRLTYTDNSVYADFQTNSSGNLLLSPTGTMLGFATDNAIDVGATGANRPRALFLASPSITVGSGTGVTVNDTGSVRRVTYKVTVTSAALSAAATTADKTVATFPAKTKVIGIYADTTTKYIGGAVSACTLKVGKTVGGAEYVASHDVFTAATTKGLADTDLGASINRAGAVQGGDLPSWTGTTNVSVRITTTGANTNALTQGSTTYYIDTVVYP